MSNSLYSFDSGRDFAPPSAIAGESIRGSKWAEETLGYAFDTQDDMVNSTLKVHSSNDFFGFTPELERQTQSPHLPTSAKVNTGDPSSYRKPEVGISGGSGSNIYRPKNPSEMLHMSADALKPTNSNSLYATPTSSTNNREQNSDLYGLGGLLSSTLPESDDGNRGGGNRLPFLSNGRAAPGGSRRNSTSSGNRIGSDVYTTAVPLLSTPAGLSKPAGTAAKMSSSDSAEASKRSSVQLASPPSSRANANASMDAQKGRSPLYGALQPLLTRKSSTGSQIAPKREPNDKEAAQLHTLQKAASGSPSTTLVGLQGPTDAPHVAALGHTYPSGAGVVNNTQRNNAAALISSPTPVRSASFTSNRSQSHGDLRRRSRSRSSEHGSFSGLSGSSPEHRNRFTPQPSSATDDEIMYFPFGLIEVPTMQLGATATAQSSMHTAGVAGDGTRANSRSKSDGRAPSPRQQTVSSLNKGAFCSPTSGDSPAAHRSYDWSFVKDFGNGEDDTEEDVNGNLLDYSALAQPPPKPPKDAIARQRVEADVFKDGDYGNLTSIAAVAVDRSKLQQMPSPAPLSTPPASREPAAGLRSPQSLSVISLSTYTSDAALSNAPARLEKKLPAFASIPMMTSAMSPSGRHFAFDGPKGTSPKRQNHSRQPSPSTVLLQEKSDPTRNAVMPESKLEADKLPSLASRTGQNSERTTPSAKGSTTSPIALASPTVKSSLGGWKCSVDTDSLPSIAPATRQHARPLAGGHSHTSPSNTPFTRSSSLPHCDPLKATAGDTASKPALTDASLSSIASDKDSVASIGTTEQHVALHKTLRPVQSSVRIHTNINEADLLPMKNEPLPLQPPPHGIMIKQRVFDPQHPFPRGPKMRELPGGKRQANWVPPETHYTTTLADLSAYEDDEDLNAEEEAAKLLAIQDFNDDIWGAEDVEVDRSSSLVKPSPTITTAMANANSSLPAAPPRGMTAVSAVSAELPAAALIHSPNKPPTIHSSGLNSTHKLSLPAAPVFALPPTAVTTTAAALFSFNTDGPQGAANGSANTALHASKRYDGIVVDEVEKVRRMREDSISASLLDDSAILSTRKASLSVSEGTGSTHQPFDTSQLVSPPRLIRSKSPVLISRDFNLRSIDTEVKEGASNRGTSVLYCVTSGGPDSLSETIRPLSHSTDDDSLLLLGAHGIPASPPCLPTPTFARIIAQRSGGGGGSSSSRGPHGLPDTGFKGGSRDDLLNDMGVMMDGSGVPSDRKSMVTFA